MSGLSLLLPGLLLSLLLLSCDGFHRTSFKVASNMHQLTKSSHQTIYMAGFGKPKESSEKKESGPSADAPCACGSGKAYKSCCQPFHDTAVDASTPVEIIRGRFSALCAGKGSYLIKTCHPDSKEYIPDDNTLKVGSKKTKRMIWEKEVT